MRVGDEWVVWEKVGQPWHPNVDHAEYDGSFDSKTEKLQISYKYINSDPDQGFEMYFFYEGYKR